MRLTADLPAIEPGLRVRFQAPGSSGWTVGRVSEGRVYLEEWPESSSVALEDFWESFDPVYYEEIEPIDYFPRQPLSEDDDSIPSDEDMIRIHSDGSFWAEPDDALVLYKRWVDDHDRKIYEAARREIEAELGVDSSEEN